MPTTKNGRRDFLRDAAACSAGVLLAGLAGCVPAAYAAWIVSIPGNDPTGVERGLASLERIFLALGFVKFDRTPGLLDSYWLPPSGQTMVRIKAGSDTQKLLVIFSEGGEKTFSQTGQRRVAAVAEELAKTFGVDRVVQTEL